MKYSKSHVTEMNDLSKFMEYTKFSLLSDGWVYFKCGVNIFFYGIVL